LGLAPRLAPLDRPRVQVDGRDHRDEEPTAQVIHITRGDSREHRPALNPVMVELIVEPHAGIPVLRPPLRGNSREAQDVGAVRRPHVHQGPITSGMTSGMADRAIDRAAHLPQLAQTPMTGITRVPAPVTDAQAAFAHVAPQAMAPLTEHDRDGAWPSSDGGVPQCWVLISSERRQTQAQRPIDTGVRTPRDQEGHAWKR
jgi:hypothetical protein